MRSRCARQSLKIVSVAGMLLSFSLCGFAQTPEMRFIADTLVVQAEGTFEADPDLATLTFQIFSQDKQLQRAYDAATQSMKRISGLAERSGLKPADVSSGVLTINPVYEGDRKKRARSYYVLGQMKLQIRDFSRIGPILDGSVDDGVGDFRSLTYSLSDEESAKKKAVADAMRRAIGRASAALEQKGQKLGALRYMSLDVKQFYAVARLNQSFETLALGAYGEEHKAPAPPPPPPQPEKITVSAAVQCAFQIQ